MSIEIGDWGLFPWFEEDDCALVHPDDLNDIKSFRPYGNLFECVSKDDCYISIRHNKNVFRVKEVLFNTVPTPAKKIGDFVSVIKSGKVIKCKVEGIGWHNQKKSHIYQLSSNGKVIKKYYFMEDFL